MAEYTGLVDGVTAALADTYRGAPVHAPGRVFTDLAVAVADGADAISGISVLGDRQGPVRSGRLDADHLAGAGPGHRGEPPDGPCRPSTGEGSGVGRGHRPGLGCGGCAWTSMPPSRSRTARRRMPRRPGRRRSGSTRCCVSWIVVTWPAVKR